MKHSTTTKMRIRTNFVSNSSSSSYVVFGVINPPKIPLEPESPEDRSREAMNKYWKELDDYRVQYAGFWTGDDEHLFGLILADEQSGFPLPPMVLNMEELKIKAKPIADVLGVSVESFKLYIGERPT
jgi:hypothetical protein